MTIQRNAETTSYFRAVIVERGRLAAVSDGRQVFGRRATAVERLPEERGAFCFVKLDSKTVPPPYLEPKVPKRTRGDDVIYTYRVCVSDLALPNRPGFIIAAPSRKVLGELHSSKVEFAKFDLAQLCDDQFSSASDPHVTVVRVHLRIYGEIGDFVTSATFYGRDVLKAESIRDLLRGQRISVDSPPFVRMRGLPAEVRRLEVQSCRLLYEDGESKFSLNVDKFGNFAFKFDGAHSLESVAAVLRYVDRVHALERADADPTKRSDVALNAVE